MTHEETVDILEEVLNSIRTNGVKRTLDLLKSSNSRKAVDITDPLDNYIVGEILSRFDMTYDQLFFSRYIRGENKFVIGMCVYYLYRHRTMAYIKKKILPSKSKQLLGQYRKMIMDLKPSTPEHAKYVKIKAELDTAIEQYKKNKKQ